MKCGDSCSDHSPLTVPRSGVARYHEPSGHIWAPAAPFWPWLATYVRPLGRGFLTGRFKTIDDLPADDFRRTAPRFQGENFRKNLELVEKIEELAAAKGCTPSQLALAWVLAQGQD